MTSTISHQPSTYTHISIYTRFQICIRTYTLYININVFYIYSSMASTISHLPSTSVCIFQVHTCMRIFYIFCRNIYIHTHLLHILQYDKHDRTSILHTRIHFHIYIHTYISSKPPTEIFIYLLGIIQYNKHDLTSTFYNDVYVFRMDQRRYMRTPLTHASTHTPTTHKRTRTHTLLPSFSFPHSSSSRLGFCVCVCVCLSSSANSIATLVFLWYGSRVRSHTRARSCTHTHTHTHARACMLLTHT